MREARKRGIAFKAKAKSFFSGVGIITLILIALFVFFTILSKKFLTANNMYNLARASAVNGICALGMSICIYVGGIDLTIGSLVGMTTMIIAAFTTSDYGGPVCEWYWTLPIVIAAGLAVGFIVGILVNDGGLPPYIATLAFQMMLRSVCQLISNATNLSHISEAYKTIADHDTDILGIPLMAFVWILLIVISWLMLNHTRFGRNIYSVGSNAETARLSGISLRKTRCGAWMYSGLMSVIAGILLGARLGGGMPTTGIGYETDAIASSVIGGASMAGGEGSIIGAVIGTIILQTLRNGSQLLGWNTFIIEMIIGILIVVCVLLDGKQRKIRL